MKKYYTVITNEIQRQLSFRMEVYAYRIGNILEILFQILLWSVLFSNNTVIRGYTYNQMLTYIVMGWFLTYFTLNYQLEDMVARDIKDGTLSNFLTKPLPYAKYLFARSIGRGSLSVLTAVVFQIIFFVVMWGKILPPSSTWAIIIIAAMLVGSYVNRFLWSMIMGSTAFWTTETAGLFYCLRFITNFLSGSTLAINLLPVIIAQICLSLPFVYFYYVPAQLYLGTITLNQGLIGLGIECAWTLFLYGLVKIIWMRGLKLYEGVGI